MALSGLFFDASGTLFRSSPHSQFGLELYPDAERILKKIQMRKFLNQSIKTAIITNWGTRIFEVLDELKLKQHFDAVFCVDGYNPPKPNIAMFQNACRELELNPSTVFHLGDSLNEDALAAQNAGLEALWIDRAQGSNTVEHMQPRPKEYVAKLKHRVIHSLDEVESVLKEYYLTKSFTFLEGKKM